MTRLLASALSFIGKFALHLHSLEAFIGGYVKGLRFDLNNIDGSDEAREEFKRYHDSAITYDGQESDVIAEAARENSVYLVVPVIEKDGGTLYCSVGPFVVG